jgi:hypothetical protein
MSYLVIFKRGRSYRYIPNIVRKIPHNLCTVRVTVSGGGDDDILIPDGAKLQKQYMGHSIGHRRLIVLAGPGEVCELLIC